MRSNQIRRKPSAFCRLRWSTVSALAMPLLITACAAPLTPVKLEAAQVVLPSNYTTQSVATTPSSDQAWWSRLGDPVLSTLVKTALERNQDLDLALSKLKQLQATEAKAAADLLPNINVGGSIAAQRNSLQDPQTRFAASQPGYERNTTIVRAESSFSWELDFFGRKEALALAARDRSFASEADLAALRLSVSAEVARQVVNARALQRRLLIAQSAAAIESDLVSIVSAKQRGGQVAQVDVLRAQSLAQDSLATGARLQSDYGEVISALSILLSDTPQAVRQQLETPTNLSADVLTNIVDSGLPSDLLRRRPDVRRAELLLGASSRDLEAVNAQRFPKLNLGSSLALVAGSLSKLTRADAVLASLTPSVTWQALDFGRLDADIAFAKAAERESLVNYRKTVVVAFAEAETALDDLLRRAQYLRLTQESVDAQQQAAQISRLQYERGLVDLSTVLETQRNVARTQESVALASQAQALAVVAAYRSLGGGWQGADQNH